MVTSSWSGEGFISKHIEEGGAPRLRRMWSDTVKIGASNKGTIDVGPHNKKKRNAHMEKRHMLDTPDNHTGA